MPAADEAARRRHRNEIAVVLLLALLGGLLAKIPALFGHPVLEENALIYARIFTPLFAVLLLGLIVTMALTGGDPSADREILIMFAIVLALVLGLVLYTMSARDTERPAGRWDGIVLALVVLALVADAIAFSGIIGRLAAYGISPNKTAALGENIALMVNLVLLAVGYVRFLTWRSHYETVIVRASFRRSARPFPVA